MLGFSKSEKELKELRESVERIEHAFKKLEIEWTDTYDKFRQLHWRVAKRVKQLESQAPETETTQPTGGDEASPENSSLSVRQRSINEQILARRNRVMVARNGG